MKKPPFSFLFIAGICAIGIAAIFISVQSRYSDEAGASVFLSSKYRVQVVQGGSVGLIIPPKKTGVIEICQEKGKRECVRLSENATDTMRVDIPSSYQLGRAVIVVRERKGNTIQKATLMKRSVFVVQAIRATTTPRPTLVPDRTVAPIHTLLPITIPTTQPTNTPPRTSRCAPYICSDGTTAPRCSTEGYPISYFVAPCRFHGGGG